MFHPVNEETDVLICDGRPSRLYVLVVVWVAEAWIGEGRLCILYAQNVLGLV